MSKDSIKSIFEKLDELDDLAEQVTETKYDYGTWVLSFDNLIEQLKSAIQKEFDEGFFRKKSTKTDELNDAIDGYSQTKRKELIEEIITDKQKIHELCDKIKELEDKLKEMKIEKEVILDDYGRDTEYLQNKVNELKQELKEKDKEILNLMKLCKIGSKKDKKVE